MKLVRRTFGLRALLLLPLVVTTMTACGAPWRDGYFKKGVHRLTQEDVSEKMGPPHTAKTPALGGDTIWTYRVPYSDKDLDPMDLSGITNAANEAASLIGKAAQDGPKPTLYCYRYTLMFDEQKILKSWKREECVPGTRNALHAD
jgi:hypothetical protein